VEVEAVVLADVAVAVVPFSPGVPTAYARAYPP
jgi:hypothetical protein